VAVAEAAWVAAEAEAAVSEALMVHLVVVLQHKRFSQLIQEKL